VKGVPHWWQLLLSATHSSALQSISTMVKRCKHTRTPLGNSLYNLEEDGRRMKGEEDGEARNIGWVHQKASRTNCVYV